MRFTHFLTCHDTVVPIQELSEVLALFFVEAESGGFGTAFLELENKVVLVVVISFETEEHRVLHFLQPLDCCYPCFLPVEDPPSHLDDVSHVLLGGLVQEVIVSLHLLPEFGHMCLQLERDEGGQERLPLLFALGCEILVQFLEHYLGLLGIRLDLREVLAQHLLRLVFGLFYQLDPFLQDLHFDEFAFPILGVEKYQFDVLLGQVHGLLLLGSAALGLLVGPAVLHLEQLQSAVGVGCKVLPEELDELPGVFGPFEDEGTPDQVLQEHVGAVRLDVSLEGGVVQLLLQFDQTALQQLAGCVGLLHALDGGGLDRGGLDGGGVALEDLTPLYFAGGCVAPVLPRDEQVQEFLELLVGGLLDAVSTCKAVVHDAGVHGEPGHR